MKEVLYDWGGLNVWLFHAINNLRADWLDAAMRWGTWLGDHDRFPLYLAVLGIAALVHLRHSAGDAAEARTRTLLAVMATFSVAYFLDGWVVTWLKTMLDFPRPPLALPSGTLHVIGRPELHHSLPSGHATFAATVAASLWPLFRHKGRAAFTLFVLWVAVSRVSLGVHFPADVLAGSLLGVAVVGAIRFVATCPHRRQANSHS